MRVSLWGISHCLGRAEIFVSEPLLLRLDDRIGNWQK